MNIVQGNYFFIDGSALTAQIRQLWREDDSFKGRKLCPKLLIQYFMMTLRELHGDAYKRVTFYFPRGDETAVEDYLVMPDHKNPGEIRDIHFKYCGEKLKRSAEFLEFVETKVPAKFRGRFSKSEKGIDIEICCDAFKLASASRLERLFLFTNDDDFVPFCRTIKEYGANISIIHLLDTVNRNLSLLREADTYDIVDRRHLQSLFLPIPESTTPQQEPSVSALKPAGPSDMALEGTIVSPAKPHAAPSDMTTGGTTASDEPNVEKAEDE
jgi:uncharacterized LabA/DUF88 family protein